MLDTCAFCDFDTYPSAPRDCGMVARRKAAAQVRCSSTHCYCAGPPSCGMAEGDQGVLMQLTQSRQDIL